MADKSFCNSEPDVQKYICPCDYLEGSNFGFQKGGDCYPGHCGKAIEHTSCLGATQKPLGLNPGCPNFPPSPSELAWDMRYSHPPPSVQKGGRKGISKMSREEYRFYKQYKKYKKLYKNLKR